MNRDLAPSTYRRAFSTLGCPALSLDQVIDLAARHGVHAVELRAVSGTVELPELFSRQFGEPSALTAHLRESPVAVVSLGTSVRLLDDRPGDRDALIAFAPWADAAGARSLRVFDGGETADAAELDRARALLRWWRDIRDKRGWRVDLVVETHDALAHPAALARFLDGVPDAALLWDAHHTWKKGGQHPIETWPLVRDRTAHIHVKDSIARPGPRLPYTYVLPGTGEFPMQALRAALAENAFAGIVSLEWELMWHPDLPPLDTAFSAAASAGWW